MTAHRDFLLVLFCDKHDFMNNSRDRKQRLGIGTKLMRSGGGGGANNGVVN